MVILRAVRRSVIDLFSAELRCSSERNERTLSWQSDGSLDAEILGLRTLDKLLRDLLEGIDLSAGQGDSDLVGFWSLAELFLWLLVRHCVFVYPSRLERSVAAK